MNQEDIDESAEQDNLPRSRLQLLWDVLVFQGKLAVDGFRDLILLPISMFSALFGLIFGGSQPDQYFQRVLEFGRRTEHWINLFGNRESSGTSDDILRPLQERVFEEAEGRPWIKSTGDALNRKLDSVAASANKRRPSSPDKSE
ncbi:MAG: hypothetical protein V2I41_08525 [Pseudomonadales bacterium]|jgi:hypothetical protein|nr:hypothetical protein [Pseudomonadales bacterium]